MEWLIKCYKFAHFIPTLLALRILARMHPSYAMWHTAIISELVGVGMIEIYMQVGPNGLNIELLCRGTKARSRYRARNSVFFSFFKCELFGKTSAASEKSGRVRKDSFALKLWISVLSGVITWLPWWHLHKRWENQSTKCLLWQQTCSPMRWLSAAAAFRS